MITDKSLPSQDAAGQAEVAAQSQQSSPSKDASHTVVPQEPITWTTERVAFAAKGGPLLIDIKVRVGRDDLSTSLKKALAARIGELKLSFDPPMSWEELLKQPLIASGWLGNLVPTEEQMTQFLSLYDANRNSCVDPDEIDAFLTRGLVRMPRIRISTGTANEGLYNSSWGPIDVDDDGQLTEVEWSEASKILTRFDFDGDQAVTRREFTPEGSAPQMMGMPARRRSLIDSNSYCSLSKEQIDSTITALLEAYSFGDSIAVQDFYSWSAEELAALDQDGNGQLTRTELKQLATRPAHCELDISLPSTVQSHDKVVGNSAAGRADEIAKQASVNEQASPNEMVLDGRIVHPAGATPRAHWQTRGSSGRIDGDGSVISVRVRDDYSQNVRQQLIDRLGEASSNPALFAMFQARLDLKSGAEEVLRAAGAASAWDWATGLRQSNVVVNWELPEDGWFELIDGNGDGRITESELRGFSKIASKWDRNQDRVLTVEESPLTVLLVVERSDPRGVFLTPGGTGIEKRGANEILAPTWFLGMDYNSDGELSRAEFLGEASDFDRLDLNGDGVIEANEVRR